MAVAKLAALEWELKPELEPQAPLLRLHRPRLMHPILLACPAPFGASRIGCPKCRCSGTGWLQMRLDSSVVTLYEFRISKDVTRMGVGGEQMSVRWWMWRESLESLGCGLDKDQAGFSDV